MAASETESNFEVVLLEDEEDLAQAVQTGYPDLLGRNDDQHVFGRMEKLDVLVQRFRQKAFHLEEEQASLYLMLTTLKHDSDIEMIEKSATGRPNPFCVFEIIILVYYLYLFSFLDCITEKVGELKNMLIGVDLKITTERRKHEEEALHTVNLLIDKVISQVQHDLINTKEICYSLLQACQWSLGTTGFCH